MPHRSILLFASVAALGLTAPAMAQDDRYAGVLEPLEAMPQGEHRGEHGGGHHADRGDGHHGGGHGGHGTYETADGTYDGEWEGRWDGDETWHGMWEGTYTDAEGRSIDAEYHGVWMGESRFISEDGHVLSHDGHGWSEHRSRGGHHGSRGGHHGRGDHGPRFAYTAEERDQWLAECQYLMAEPYYDYDDDDGDGALLGGVLGAIVGGVAGNQIAGDGDRLLGTVLGAGLGGLAGAGIGSILDGDGDGEIDRHELWAARYCEAYLQRYEAGAAVAYAQPMTIIPVRTGHGHSGHNCRSCSGETVIIEEWEEVIERPRRPRPRPTPRPQGSKLTPLN